MSSASPDAAFAPLLRLRELVEAPESESVEGVSKATAASGNRVDSDRMASSSEGGGAVYVTGVTFGAKEIVCCEEGSTGDVHVNWNAVQNLEFIDAERRWAENRKSKRRVRDIN